MPKRSLLFITCRSCRFGQLNEGICLGYFSAAVTEYLTKSSLEEKRVYSSRGHTAHHSGGCVLYIRSRMARLAAHPQSDMLPSSKAPPLKGLMTLKKKKSSWGDISHSNYLRTYCWLVVSLCNSSWGENCLLFSYFRLLCELCVSAIACHQHLYVHV